MGNQFAVFNRWLFASSLYWITKDQGFKAAEKEKLNFGDVSSPSLHCCGGFFNEHATAQELKRQESEVKENVSGKYALKNQLQRAPYLLLQKQMMMKMMMMMMMKTVMVMLLPKGCLLHKQSLWGRGVVFV